MSIVQAVNEIENNHPDRSDISDRVQTPEETAPSESEKYVLDYIDKFSVHGGEMKVFRELDRLENNLSLASAERVDAEIGVSMAGCLGTTLLCVFTSIIGHTYFGVDPHTIAEAMGSSIVTMGPINTVLGAYYGNHVGTELQEESLAKIKKKTEALQQARNKVFDTAYEPQDIVLLNHEGKPALMYGRDVDDQDVITVMDRSDPVKKFKELKNSPVFLSHMNYPAIASSVDDTGYHTKLSVNPKYDKRMTVTLTNNGEPKGYIDIHTTGWARVFHLTPRRPSRGPYR